MLLGEKLSIQINWLHFLFVVNFHSFESEKADELHNYAQELA